MNTIKGSNSLDPDQAWYFVGPDLDPSCLIMLSADDISKQRVQVGVVFQKGEFNFQLKKSKYLVYNKEI